MTVQTETAQVHPLAGIHSSATAASPLHDMAVGGEADLSDQQKLKIAFEYFNQVSGQLTDAYQALELQVKDLRAQLADAEARHQAEVADKALVTGRLEGLLNILPVGVVVLDVRGGVQQCNPAAVELLGEPLLGERWLEIIQRSFAPRLDDGHEVSLKDGRRVSLATRSLEGQRGQLIVLTDMTETRDLMERLSRHQRLSSLGKMVASLAHQIRTPLTAAMLYAEHLGNPELKPEQQQRFTGKLSARLNHLEQQVRDMLIFAKGDMPLADRADTGQLASGIEAAAEASLEASESHLTISNQAQGCLLQCNLEALVGAILNLINNAVQAVGRGAQIEICLQHKLADEEAPGFLLITVQDKGPGIDPSVRETVLEPFVTTKSQGTGLGLAVVQAVVRAHQGEFEIASTCARGTTVVLRLPVWEAFSNLIENEELQVNE